MSEKTGIKLSTKTWHYKLMKFVLGSTCPTPQNMHNLCPYFWLMIFSVFAAPIVVFFKGVAKILNWLINGLADLIAYVLIEPTAANWFRGLDDSDVYAIYNYDKDVPKLYTKAKLGRNKYGYSKDRSDVIDEFFEKKHGFSMYALNKDGGKSRVYSDEFTEWAEKQRVIKKEIRDKYLEELRIRKANRTIKFDEIGDKVGESLDNMIDSMKSWTNIIKWTKRFVGGLITLGGLTGLYFVVNFVGRGFLWMIENFNGPAVLEELIAIGIVLGVVVVICVLFFITRLWVLYVKEQGLKLWYTKMVYYPLYWFIFIPFKFIIVDLIWVFSILNLTRLVVGGAKGVWFGLLSFTGIFGEYFGASYTDYCPGIEWEENDKKETE